MSEFEKTMIIPKIDYYGNDRVRVSPEAVMSLADQTNGNRAVRAILEHDPHYVPIGKVASMSIEEKENHFVVRTTTDDTHEIRRFRHTITAQDMVEVTFTNDGRPFIRKTSTPESVCFVVSADAANFRRYVRLRRLCPGKR